MKPRIAIPLPTATDFAYNHSNWAAYADGVLASGAEPVRFSLDLSRREGAALAATCQGIVLPGSPADVEPGRYGQARDEASAPADPKREAIDELLLEAAFEAGKPVVAICFGMQFLNVWRGGTLIQDLSIFPVNHAAGRAIAVAHTATIAADSLLASMADAAEVWEVDEALRLEINSSHHQAVGIPGQGLKVSSRCPQDGVVESIELGGATGHFVLGVQWHPERTYLSSPTSKAVFARLIHEAETWRSVHVATAVG